MLWKATSDFYQGEMVTRLSGDKAMLARLIYLYDDTASIVLTDFDGMCFVG